MSTTAATRMLDGLEGQYTHAVIAFLDDEGYPLSVATGFRAESERGAALDAAERYVRVCLETLNGFRPASHLRALAGTAPLADAVSQLARRRNNGPMIRRIDRAPAPLPSSRRCGAG